MKLQRLLNLCLVALLVAGLLVTAAPGVAAASARTGAPVSVAAQAATADDVSGTYVSNVYPAASAPGLLMLMSLYPNNNAEVVSFYFSNPPITETGTWELSGDQVAVTLTANSEGEFDTPATETLRVQGDMLVSGSLQFTRLGEVTPAEMEAASNAAADDAAADDAAASDDTAATEDVAASDEMTGTEAAAAEETATADVAAGAEMTGTEEMTDTATATDAAPAGDDAATGGAAYEVFVTDVYPAADAPGMVTLLALYPNMNMEQLTVYLGKDVIHEVGTWSDATEGFVDVSVTGPFDGTEYETPVATSYAREGELLSDGVFTFHQLRVLTPADMDRMSSPAGTYVSKLYPAADASGLLTVLSLFDNNNVEQVSIYIGKDTIVEQGTWTENDDGSITVSITGTAEQEYASPSETKYTRTGEMLSDGTFELTRVEVVTPEQLAASGGATGLVDEGAGAAGDTAGETAAPMATYTSDLLPAADSPGRVITLALYEDGVAEMTTDFQNGTVYTETGTYEQGEAGQLTVTLTGSSDQGEYANPVVIGFEETAGMLTAVDYDDALYGSEGLMLHEDSK
jgi:hypothetical protein